jgi:hypothetical protein
MAHRLPLDAAAHAYWRASRAIRCGTAPDQSAETAIVTLIDMAGFLAQTHPPVAARAASALRDLGLMTQG